MKTRWTGRHSFCRCPAKQKEWKRKLSKKGQDYWGSLVNNLGYWNSFEIPRLLFPLMGSLVLSICSISSASSGLISLGGWFSASIGCTVFFPLKEILLGSGLEDLAPEEPDAPGLRFLRLGGGVMKAAASFSLRALAAAFFSDFGSGLRPRTADFDRCRWVGWGKVSRAMTINPLGTRSPSTWLKMAMYGNSNLQSYAYMPT